MAANQLTSLINLTVVYKINQSATEQLLTHQWMKWIRHCTTLGLWLVLWPSGGTLAHAFLPRRGEAHFDRAERWTLNGHKGHNLFMVTAHEIGHTLGLEHSPVRHALMSPYYRKLGRSLVLSWDDIIAVQQLYGEMMMLIYCDRFNPPVCGFIVSHSDSCGDSRGMPYLWNGKCAVSVGVSNVAPSLDTQRYFYHLLLRFKVFSGQMANVSLSGLRTAEFGEMRLQFRITGIHGTSYTNDWRVMKPGCLWGNTDVGSFLLCCPLNQESWHWAVKRPETRRPPAANTEWEWVERQSLKTVAVPHARVSSWLFVQWNKAHSYESD